MTPMLLSEATAYRDTIGAAPSVYVQPKLDGWRGIVNTRTGAIYSRSGRLLDLPHITAAILAASGLPEWLDGELYAHGYTLGQIGTMIKRADPMIKFYCFDAIIPGMFSRRLEVVRSIMESDTIRTVATAKISPSEISRYYNEYLGMGMEGVVIRLDAEYHQGRSEKIFKMKPGM
ncbi:MAG TPA: hypothetical protein PKY31_04140 [Spirochaetota bacterium]|nr:hypothetical protein [Spirochaetota bacterium]